MFYRSVTLIQQARESAQQGHLPVYRQLLEMAFLKLCYSIGPGFYHKARLWRRDIPFRSKTRYRVGQRYKAIVDAINDRRYFKLSQHKIAEKALFSLFGIASAEFYGFFHPETGRTSSGFSLTNAADFLALCSRSALTSMAVKMPEGCRGYGFDIIDINASDSLPIYSRALEKRFSPEDYLQLKLHQFEEQGLVLEAVIEQHPALRQLNASSVNTLRVWVRQSGGRATVKSALLKVGSPGSLSDYTEFGGLSVSIDIQTGALGTPRLRPRQETVTSDEQLGIRLLEGFEVPFLREAFALAEHSLTVFPCLNFVGVDIAFTVEGPLIVELNVEPDSGHAAMVDIPTLELLSPLPGYGKG